MLFLLILILNILFASTFIIGKAVLQFSQPIFFIAFRMILAGTLLLFYSKYFLKQKFNFNKTDLIIFSKLSLFHIYLPFVFEFWALQYVTAAKTSLLFNLSPFLTAVLAYLFYNEKLNKQKLIGLFIGFFGFIPILIEKCNGFNEFLCISLPEICIILAVIFSAYAWILIQKFSNDKTSFSILNGISMFFGGVLALITSLLIENWSPVPVSNWSNFLYLTILIIIIANFICYNLYAFLLSRFSATFLSFAGFLIAFFTAFQQWIFFKESVTYSFYISAFLVLIGLFIFYQQELQKEGIIK